MIGCREKLFKNRSYNGIASTEIVEFVADKLTDSWRLTDCFINIKILIEEKIRL